VKLVKLGATRRAGGVGLGLYIARQLAQAQGGELLVGEPLGPGARFELRLPLADPTADGLLAYAASTRYVVSVRAPSPPLRISGASGGRLAGGGA
jgi:chemotaxis protein histidine kinase CheA